jgi:DNA-binding transcriptional LysR family regulator
MEGTVDLYKLKTFRTVGVFLNFNKAAKVLNCAQSTISVQIKSLEEEIGEFLFKRIKKWVVLTEAGEKMLFYANKLLSMEEEALADISSKKNPTGTIRLMVPESIAANYFPTLLQEFLITYPNINFDISNCSQSGLEIELRSESVDLAFLFSVSAEFLNLNSEKIFREKLVVISSPKNSLVDKKIVDTTDLHSQTLFLPKAGCGYGLFLRQLLNTDITKPSSIIEFTSSEAIKKCVMNGTGIAVLPAKSIQNEILNKQIVELNWMGDLDISVVMLWHKNRRISEPLRNFMGLIRNLKNKKEMNR